jgi:hypothetical protein
VRLLLHQKHAQSNTAAPSPQNKQTNKQTKAATTQRTRRQAERLGGKRGREEREDAAQDGRADDFREVPRHRAALRVDAEAKGHDDDAEQGH